MCNNGNKYDHEKSDSPDFIDLSDVRLVIYRDGKQVVFSKP